MSKSQPPPLSYLIIILTLATALLHLYLAFQPAFQTLQVTFVLDFGGYLAVLVLIFLPQTQGLKPWPKVALLLLTTINILGYVSSNINNLISVEGLVVKGIEVLLVILVIIDIYLSAKSNT